MSQQDRLDRVLASLHEAALDDSLWPAASGLIDQLCGSKGNILVTGDGTAADDIQVFFASFCYRGQIHPEWQREYFKVFHALDERIPRLRHLPDSQVVHASSLYTAEEMKTSPAWNEALLRSDTQDSLNVRLDGPDRSRIVWVVADPEKNDGWSSPQIETVKRLLPHIRQFVRVRQALLEARALGASLAALLENTRCGVIQLDRRGRIMAANDRAVEFLRIGDGLSDRDGFLRAASPRDDVSLQRVLARALPRFGGQGTSSSTMVTRLAGAPRLAVHVGPVGVGPAELRPAGAAALVLIADMADRFRIEPQLVAGTLGLTPAESQVAAMLAQGNTIRQIAVDTGRKPDTIRWHVKHIFSKLNVTRQVELVQLVLSLAFLPEERS